MRSPLVGAFQTCSSLDARIAEPPAAVAHLRDDHPTGGHRRRCAGWEPERLSGRDPPEPAPLDPAVHTPRRPAAGDLPDPARLDLVDEPPHGALARDERTGLDAGDRLANVLVQVAE